VKSKGGGGRCACNEFYREDEAALTKRERRRRKAPFCVHDEASCRERGGNREITLLNYSMKENLQMKDRGRTEENPFNSVQPHPRERKVLHFLHERERSGLCPPAERKKKKKNKKDEHPYPPQKNR